MKRGICVLSLIVSLFIGTLASASLIVDSGFANGIADQNTWTAGQDNVGQWYGSDYDVVDGAANLSSVVNSSQWKDLNKGRRALLMAVPIAEAGSFNWQIDCSLTDYDTQYCYWQAHLVQAGTTINLEGGPGWNSKIGGNKPVSQAYAPQSKDGGQWYTYSQDFDISQCQANNYDYVVFTFVGTRKSCQTLGYRNFSTDMPNVASVPEPAAMMMLTTGAVLLRRRQAKR